MVLIRLKFKHICCFCLQMAVEFLHELNIPFFKVGSGDTNNFPYLEKTAKKGESDPSHGRNVS